jgi:hypothetical protein
MNQNDADFLFVGSFNDADFEADMQGATKANVAEQFPVDCALLSTLKSIS